MPLNQRQQEAVDAPIDEDIVISAGAGSGKTKTLTERVYAVISKGYLKPSELLVLTFTNNAAHEMKTRIVGRFAKEKDPRISHLAEEMLSCHVQTFDSFNQYLVSKYATRLHISPSLYVMDEASYQSKWNEIVEAVLEEAYEDPSLKEQLASTLAKFSLKSDRGLKKAISDMEGELSKMTPDKKRVFLATYEENFFSDSFVNQLFHEKMNYLRKQIRATLQRAYFVQEHFEEISNIEDLDPEEWKTVFESEGFFTYNGPYSFVDEKYCRPFAQALVALQDSDDDEMAHTLARWDEICAEFAPKKLKGIKEDKERIEATWKVMKELAGNTKDSLFHRYSCQGDREKEKEKLFSFEPDIRLLLSLVEKAESRMEDFMEETNSFTFADISTLALRLLTEEEYADIADEVRHRFRYIMVDEYQDTNDAQEVFLDSLTKPYWVQGKEQRAHLFCVGDAKQSIYAFRNSNVELFRKRQRAYADGVGHRVIGMNQNYRSRPTLIDDINYVCSYYMRPDHGSIDYLDPMEALCPGQSREDGQDEGQFHLWRLMGSESPFAKKKRFSDPSEMEWEARAILEDIQKKLKEGHRVYDAETRSLRPCRSNDFVILLRTKKYFPLFRRLFNEAGIKLNEKQTENLQETRSILYLQSLVSFLKYFLHPEKEDPRHLFLSIARSYAFRGEYDDARIHSLLKRSKKEMAEGKDGLDPFRNDSLEGKPEDGIWQRMSSLAAEAENQAPSALFLELLRRFHVLDRLPSVGDVDANIQKIESLFQMIQQGESRGQGIDDFVHLFESIRTYELNFKADTLVQSADGVDMMTIHASKGLQNRIVFMPSSGNLLSSGDARSRPAFSFSEDLGFQFPYNQLDLDGVFAEENPKPQSTDTLGTFAFEIRKKQDPEVDEHVRLFYVALTRAENEIILVGNDVYAPKCEDPFSMLKNCPHHWVIDEGFARKMVECGAVSASDFDEFEAISLLMTTQPDAPFLESLSMEQKENYLALKKRYFDDLLPQMLEGKWNQIQRQAFEYYQARFRYAASGELLASFDLAKCYPTAFLQGARGKEGLKAAQEEGEELSQFVASSCADDSDSSEEEEETEDSEDLSRRLDGIQKALCEEDPDAIQDLLGVSDSAMKKAKDNLESLLIPYALNAFALLFDGFHEILRLSYQTSSYPDCRQHVLLNKKTSTAIQPQAVLTPLQVDDRVLEFPQKVFGRASKVLLDGDEESLASALDYGTQLHSYMEVLNFSSPDLSFIPSERDRKAIAACLALPPLKEASGATVYPEYAYYDEELGSTGSIDLLYEKNGVYTIVDYKTSDIDDPAYPHQVRVYQRNVCRLFHVKKSNVRLFLVSLLRHSYKEIGAEEDESLKTGLE